MKKLILIPFLLFTLLSMAACGGDNENPFTPEVPEQPGNGDKKNRTRLNPEKTDVILCSIRHARVTRSA